LTLNVAIITIRYFGGTLLGARGLVRAYSDSANMAIANANLIEFEELIEENINVDYEMASKCEYLFKKFDIKVIERNFLDGITYKIQGNKQNLKELRDVLFNQ
jgi:putative IMPACT (imprinted ancient) family translation regulator